MTRARVLASLARSAALAIALSSFSWFFLGSSTHQAQASTPGSPPCPLDQPCRILPLGDSITWGIGSDGGYRVRLFQEACAAGKHITFVGAFANGPELVAGRDFPRQHGGVSGWTIDQVATTLSEPEASHTPHIVLLQVGTNDVYAHSTPTAMADRLERLLDRLKRTVPTALVVVAQITPLRDRALSDLAVAYNRELARRVQTRRARGERLLLVDQFNTFPVELLSSDGVHPTQAGYERIAETWYASVGSLFR